jgi:hypothetical protein
MATYDKIILTDKAEKGLLLFMADGKTKLLADKTKAITFIVNSRLESLYLDSLKAKVSAITDEKTLEDIAVLIASK